MAIISSQRADYNRPNIHRIGNLQAKNKRKRVATDAELSQLNKAIIQLNEAKTSISEAEFLAKTSEAFKIARNIWRGRNV